jgi:hypothetical protein
MFSWLPRYSNAFMDLIWHLFPCIHDFSKEGISSAFMTSLGNF